jgi:superfamily I DNA/RNA helicase
VFSTAHKAKGLEFDTVRIGEDFLSDYPVDEMSKFCMGIVD